MTELHETIVDFVKVLRTADVKVSPAETLDAMEALDLVGIKAVSYTHLTLPTILLV